MTTPDLTTALKARISEIDSMISKLNNERWQCTRLIRDRGGSTPEPVALPRANGPYSAGSIIHALRDGKWRTSREICDAVKADEIGGLITALQRQVKLGNLESRGRRQSATTPLQFRLGPILMLGKER